MSSVRVDERTSINLSPQFVANFEGNPTIRLVWARSLSCPNRLLDGVFAPALGGGILGLASRLGHLLLWNCSLDRELTQSAKIPTEGNMKAKGLHQLKDGSLVFVFSFDQSVQVGGMQYFSRGGRDILLVRVSPKGISTWVHIGGPGSDSYA